MLSVETCLHRRHRFPCQRIIGNMTLHATLSHTPELQTRCSTASTGNRTETCKNLTKGYSPVIVPVPNRKVSLGSTPSRRDGRLGMQSQGAFWLPQAARARNSFRIPDALAVNASNDAPLSQNSLRTSEASAPAPFPPPAHCASHLQSACASHLPFHGDDTTPSCLLRDVGASAQDVVS